MTPDRAAPAATGDGPPSRFTRVLYIAVVVLATIALGVRIADGLRTGRTDWLGMTAPAGVLLGLTAIIVGPRRPVLYYPLLVVSFALVVASFAIPRRRVPPPAGGPPSPGAVAPLVQPAPGAR